MHNRTPLNGLLLHGVIDVLWNSYRLSLHCDTHNNELWPQPHGKSVVISRRAERTFLTICLTGNTPGCTKSQMQNVKKRTHSSFSSNLLWTAICSVEIHLTIWPQQHSPSQIREYVGKIQTYAHTNISPQIHCEEHIRWIPPKFKSVYVSMWLKLLQQSICTLCCVYVGMLSVDKSGHPCCTTDKSRSNTCPPPSHYRNTSTWEDTSQQVCSVNTEQAHFFWLDASTAFISHCRIEMCQPLEILL